MVLLSVMIALVAFNASAPGGHVLEGRAQQLAAQLESARWRAVSNERRVAWRPPVEDATAPQWYAKGPDGLWRTESALPAFEPEPGLRIALQAAHDTASPGSSNSPPQLVLGPEPAGTPACVVLTHSGRSLSVSSDGVAPFHVRQDASC